MMLFRVVGLAVCIACIAVGLNVIRAGNGKGWISVIGGAVLGASWIAQLINAAGR